LTRSWLPALSVLNLSSCAALCTTLCRITRQSVYVILDNYYNVADSPPEKHYSDATKIILPEVQKRKERAEKALATGGKPPKMSDAIGWMVEMARGKQIDYIAAQLSLTVAAIHATTEALTTALVDLAIYPEIISQLREEIIQVLSEDGWSKQSLYKMKLMDSFLKESQRMHPVSLR
jgi:Cytochrome P450